MLLLNNAVYTFYSLPRTDFHMPQCFLEAAERFALPACGRAWILFGSRKNSKRGKCLKMPQNPTRQVHALLGAFYMFM
jgi:malate synthase